MTDPDVQYLRDLAKGYANSFVEGWQSDFRRLNAMADRLESFIQAEGEKKLPEALNNPQGPWNYGI